MFSVLEGGVNLFSQSGGEGCLHQFLAAQFLHVLHHDFGQLRLAEATGHFDQPIFPRKRVVVSLQRGRGRAEEHFRTEHRAPEDGGVTGMVARCRVLLLETRLVFLVHHDQSGIAEGEEEGGAHTENQGVGMVGELSLPEFDSVAVGELGVIDSHVFAEDAAQAFRDLGGEGDFGQEIEHLTSLSDFFFDEADIDFRFAAGGHAVEQADVLLFPTAADGVEGVLLLFVKLFAWEQGNGFGGGAVKHEGITFHHAFLLQCPQGGVKTFAAAGEVGAAHLLQKMGMVEFQGGASVSEVEIGQQALLLGGGSAQTVQHLVQGGFVGVGVGQSHVGFGARRETASHLFEHLHRPDVHQSAHGGQEVLNLQPPLDVGEAHTFLCTQFVPQAPLAGGEFLGVAVPILRARHQGLALGFQPRWQGGFHDLARRTNIITRHPLPEAELLGRDDGCFIPHFLHFLQRDAGFGILSGEADDDAGVVAFLSKLHDDTTAHSHLAFQSGGQEVSVGVLQGKRKKELDKHGQCGFAVVKVTG